MIKVVTAGNLLLVAYSITTIYSYSVTRSTIASEYQYIEGKIDGYLNKLEAESLKIAKEKLNGKIFFLIDKKNRI